MKHETKKTRISHIPIVKEIPEEFKDPGIVGLALGPNGERYSPQKEETADVSKVLSARQLRMLNKFQPLSPLAKLPN